MHPEDVHGDSIVRGCVDSPLPPNRTGQLAQIQRPEASFLVHSASNVRRSSGVTEEGRVAPPVRKVVVEPAADLLSEGLGLGRVRQVHRPGTYRRGRAPVPTAVALPFGR